MKVKLYQATIAVLSLYFLASCAEIKDTGRTIGHASKDIATSIGHGTRDAAKSIGKNTKKVIKGESSDDDDN